MKDHFQSFLHKLANNVTPGPALLFGDDLADHIKSFNNIASLMKPAKMLNKKYLVKTQKFQPSRGSSAYGKERQPARATNFLVAITLDKIGSRSKADTTNTD